MLRIGEKTMAYEIIKNLELCGEYPLYLMGGIN
jgi:hypothetical protein